MDNRIAVIPSDDHLDHYLEYPRRANPAMKALFVETMESGLAVHIEHDLPSQCVFQRTEVVETRGGHGRSGRDLPDTI